MAEWSNAAVLKTAEPETVPGVRIPLLPPLPKGSKCYDRDHPWFDYEVYQFPREVYQID